MYIYSEIMQKHEKCKQNNKINLHQHRIGGASVNMRRTPIIKARRRRRPGIGGCTTRRRAQRRTVECPVSEFICQQEIRQEFAEMHGVAVSLLDLKSKFSIDWT